MASANAVLELRKKLEKRFKDSVEIFPDFTTVKQIDVVPSGCAIVDAVTGISRNTLQCLHF